MLSLAEQIGNTYKDDLHLVFALAKYVPNKMLMPLGVEHAPLPFALYGLIDTCTITLSKFWRVYAMQTTVNVDDKLIEEAAKLADTQNQSQLIELALSEFIKHHQPDAQKSTLLELYGAGGIREDYDYKALHKRAVHLSAVSTKYRDVDNHLPPFFKQARFPDESALDETTTGSGHST